MTILRIINRGLDRAAYDAITARVDLERQHPLGLIMHGATEVDSIVQVAQVWESEEHARRFDEEHLNPVLQGFGARVDAADITTFELHHLVTP